MLYKYPRANHYLVYKRVDEDIYKVENHMFEGECHYLEKSSVEFLRKLDGKTDPYTISDDWSEDEVTDWLYLFEEEKLIEFEKRMVKIGRGSVAQPLIIPKIGKAKRIFGRLWNDLLFVSFMPALIWGIHTCFSRGWKWIDSGMNINMAFCYLICMVISMAIHELSHGASCIGYGGYWFDIGVGMMQYLPCAFVTIKYSNVRSRFRRAQIMAAGAEANLLLAGLSLGMLKFGIFDSSFLVYFGTLNLIVGVYNLSFLTEGVDGMKIMSELFARDFLERAKILVMDKRAKKELKEKNGIYAYATIAACYTVIALQAILPIIVLTNIVYVIREIL